MMSATRYAVLAACSFLVSLLATAVFKRIALKRAWVDEAGSDALKIHNSPTPFVGGFGIFLGTVAPLALVTAGQFDTVWALALLSASGLVVFILGLRDDLSTVPPLVRLGVEVAVGIGLSLGGLATSLCELRWSQPSGAVGAGVFVGLTVIYVAGAINAVNMLDGLDGLAGGVALISCIGFAIIGIFLGQWLATALALALGGSLLAFLVFNFHPASVFMGDNGSYFVGLMLAVIAILLTSASGTIWGVVGGVLLIGAPVFDSVFAIVRRLRRRVSPFSGDRGHFYDYLSKRGLSTRSVALVGYGLQIVFVAAGAAVFVGLSMK
jgi:UDP-GlcNAc:undecaprenyl-phosphate GlcNAc-1-phosphate transferase